MPKGNPCSKYSRYFVPDVKGIHQLGVWKCDKCERSFSPYTHLKAHKSEVHTYHNIGYFLMLLYNYLPTNRVYNFYMQGLIALSVSSRWKDIPKKA